MDQLIRETQPPAGTLRSPVPQYWNPDTEKYERVLGVHGAPRAMLYGPNGQPISTSNRLPVDVGAQVATESTLAEAVSRLNAILTRLEGTLDVDVGGQIHADVDLGDVTVQIGEVQQGKRGAAAEPWEVTLTGHIEETVIDRQVRTSQVTVHSIPVPVHARGAIVSALIHGVTGTFGQDEGYWLRVINSNSRVLSPLANVQYRLTDTTLDPSTTSNRSQIVVIYPGQFEFDPYSTGVVRSALVQSPIGPVLMAILNITGTFAPGEGVDCEVRVTWIR